MLLELLLRIVSAAAMISFGAGGSIGRYDECLSDNEDADESLSGSLLPLTSLSVCNSAACARRRSFSAAFSATREFCLNPPELVLPLPPELRSWDHERIRESAVGFADVLVLESLVASAMTMSSSQVVVL